jgi:hypothetical protein
MHEAPPTFFFCLVDTKEEQSREKRFDPHLAFGGPMSLNDCAAERQSYRIVSYRIVGNTFRPPVVVVGRCQCLLAGISC